MTTRMIPVMLLIIAALCAGAGAAYGVTPSYQPVGGVIYMPNTMATYIDGIVPPTAMSTSLVDSTQDEVGTIFKIGKVAGRITHVYINPYSYGTGAGTDTIFTVRLETVGADGMPSGTLITGAAEKTYNAGVNADGLGGFWVDLGADSVAVTTDQLIALKIAASNATASGNVNFATAFGSTSFTMDGLFPHVVERLAGDAVDNNAPVFGYKMGGKPMYCGMFPVDSMVTYPGTAWDTASTPDEIGLRFRSAYSMKAAGMWGWIRMSSTRIYVAMTIYNAWDDVLYSDTIGDGYTSFPTGTLYGRIHVWFDDDIELKADSIYRITMRPTQADYDLSAYAIRVTDSSDWYAFDGGGPQWHGTMRTDGGAWTDMTNPEKNYRWFCGPIISYLSAGIEDEATPSGKRRIEQQRLFRGWMVRETQKCFAGANDAFIR